MPVMWSYSGLQLPSVKYVKTLQYLLKAHVLFLKRLSNVCDNYL